MSENVPTDPDPRQADRADDVDLPLEPLSGQDTPDISLELVTGSPPAVTPPAALAPAVPTAAPAPAAPPAAPSPEAAAAPVPQGDEPDEVELVLEVPPPPATDDPPPVADPAPGEEPGPAPPAPPGGRVRVLGSRPAPAEPAADDQPADQPGGPRIRVVRPAGGQQPAAPRRTIRVVKKRDGDTP